jgi:hypothetical protein
VGSTGSANDTVSSVIVGPRTRAILYQDSNFGGKRNPLEGTSHVAVTLYNGMGAAAGDSASSIRVMDNYGFFAAANYLGNHPSDREAFWTESANGLAHDTFNWYVTQNDGDVPHIAKFHLTANFGNAIPWRAAMPWQLSQHGCKHYGDPDVIQHPVHGGLLVVPVEECRDPYGGGRAIAVVGIFRTSDLSFFAMDTLWAQGKTPHKTAWVAIHPSTQVLFSSGSTIDGDEPIVTYEPDWAGLMPSDSPQWIFGNPHTVHLVDPVDGQPVSLITPQGGVFSTDGAFLYLVNGNGCGTGANFIRVFNSIEFVPGTDDTFDMAVSSSNAYGRFNYEVNCSKPTPYQEPQGMAYVDMTGKGAPYGGQLHVMLLDNDDVLDTDNLFIKHYGIGP